MNFFAISGWINAAISIICAIAVLIHGFKLWRNISYFLYGVSIAVWSTFYALWQMSGDPEQAFFYSQMFMVGAIFIPILHCHHILELFNLKTKNRKQILIIGYLIALAFLSVNFTPLFIVGVVPRLDFLYWPQPGILFLPYLGYFFFYLIFTLASLWRHSRSAEPRVRNEIGWIVIGTAIGYGGGATNFLLWYGIPFPPYLNFLVSIFVLIDALIFFQLRLFDFHLFLRDSSIHLLSSLMILALIVPVVIFVGKIWAYFLSLFLLCTSFPFIYPQLSYWVRKNINRTKWGDVDRYLEEIEEKSNLLNESTLSIPELAKKTVRLLINIFPVHDAAFYLLNPKSQKFDVYKPDESIIRAKIGRDNDVLKKIVKESTPLVTQDLSGKFNNDEESLEKYPVLVPMIISNKIEGILCLGGKISGREFHRKDTRALIHLGEKLRIAYGYASTAEKYTVAMQDWAHSLNQITKPVELAAGQISLFHDSWPWEKLNESLNVIKYRVKQLQKVHDFISNSASISYQVVTGNYKMKEENLVEILGNHCSHFMGEAQGRGINFQFKFEGKNIISKIHRTSIERVLDELLGNGIRYVSKKGEGGKIIISGYEQKGNYHVVIEDNGPGIPPGEVDRIFEPGWQQKDMNKGAAGLGLAIVEQVIEAHNGKIWADSDGHTGTKFEFFIPIERSES